LARGTTTFWPLRSVTAQVLVLAACVTGPAARAEIFLLYSGGRVEGEWINRDELPPHEYRVRTASGIVASLPLDKVRDVVRQSAALEEYHRRLPLAPDTVEGQWQLAEWCRQNALLQQRKTHLARVITLYPDHQQARHALGYQFLAGEWITPQEFRRREGHEYYHGRWRTPQEIEILESRSRREQAEKDWAAKIRRYRKDLAAPDKYRLGYESLVGIKDPAAVKPLGQLFSGERDRRVKMLLADVLASIDTADALAVLVDRALNDPDEEVYYYCLDRINDLKPPHVGDPFIAALKDTSNARVNRAGKALAILGDKSALSPLIDALITTHAHVQPGRPGTGPNSTTTGFGDGGTILKQNEGPQVVVRHVQNQHVLEALTKLSGGANFGFDQKAWRFWLAQEATAREAAQPLVDARRQ
jgi:hypothetical protein